MPEAVLARLSDMDSSAAYYAEAGMMSAPGAGTGALVGLPRDVGALCAIVQGLLLHQRWAPHYGAAPTADRAADIHIRHVERLLLRLREIDARPMTEPRPAERRMIVVCRHFALLLCALLRWQGVPARARCGFAGYFATGRFEDHWVCEYWDAEAARWRLCDAQLDPVQRGLLRPDFASLDVPRDRFLSAGQAWRRCRAGEDDPARFGILDMRGLWFIGGNLLRDLAALNKVEMLPWDVWGAMPRPGQAPDPERQALLDRLSALTTGGDEAIAEARGIYQAENALRVPATVYNAVRDVRENV